MKKWLFSLILVSIFLFQLATAYNPLQWAISKDKCNNDGACDSNENEDSCPDDCLEEEDDDQDEVADDDVPPDSQGQTGGSFYSRSGIVQENVREFPIEYVVYPVIGVIVLVIIFIIYKWVKTKAGFLKKKIRFKKKKPEKIENFGLPQRPKKSGILGKRGNR